MRDIYKQGLKVLLLAKERFQKAVEYRSYRLVHKFQRYDDEVASEIQRVRKKVAVKMKDQVFDRKESISVISALNEFKRARNASRIHKGASICLSQEFMNGSVLAVIKVQLKFSLNDANRHKETIKTYAEVVRHLLRVYELSIENLSTALRSHLAQMCENNSTVLTCIALTNLHATLAVKNLSTTRSMDRAITYIVVLILSYPTYTPLFSSLPALCDSDPSSHHSPSSRATTPSCCFSP